LKTELLKQYEGKLTAFQVKQGRINSRVVCPTEMQCKEGDIVYTEKCTGIGNGVVGWVILGKELSLDDVEITSRQNIQIVLNRENMSQADQYYVWHNLQAEARTWALINGQDVESVPFLGPYHLCQYAALTGIQ
jgi:hypothetical protein